VINGYIKYLHITIYKITINDLPYIEVDIGKAKPFARRGRKAEGLYIKRQPGCHNKKRRPGFFLSGSPEP